LFHFTLCSASRAQFLRVVVADVDDDFDAVVFALTNAGGLLCCAALHRAWSYRWLFVRSFFLTHTHALAPGSASLSLGLLAVDSQGRCQARDDGFASGRHHLDGCGIAVVAAIVDVDVDVDGLCVSYPLMSTVCRVVRGAGTALVVS